MRLPMSRIAGRKPNASVQISTPGCEPGGGWMNAASHVPSGVLIVTSVSTTGCAGNAEPAAAARPAATDNAMKSRREGSATALCSFSESCLSSIVASLLLVSRLARTTHFNSIFAQNHMSTAYSVSSFSFLPMRMRESRVQANQSGHDNINLRSEEHTSELQSPG